MRRGFMQYKTAIHFFFALIVALGLSASAVAQQRKPKPMKHPPQYPNIIDSGEAQPDSAQQGGDKSGAPAAGGVSLSLQQTDVLIRAVESLSGEVRGLVQELRLLNARQQAQLDILRLTRADLRIDQYERELKATRDRLAQVENDEQQLQLALKPENLEAQMRTIPTLNRDATMRQLKESYEARLRAVQNEKDLLQRREAEIGGAIKGYREAVSDAEKRLQVMEEAPSSGAADGAPKTNAPQRRP